MNVTARPLALPLAAFIGLASTVVAIGEDAGLAARAEADQLATAKIRKAGVDTPLCPAGHLPHKGEISQKQSPAR
ncbi:hypothetical protein [Ensifer aridi]|uniref:hypothetical protein n=1 Tax=Ensifer aridi TaxID=1708715 RepID=UPI00358F33F2